MYKKVDEKVLSAHCFFRFPVFLFLPIYPAPLNVHKGYDSVLMGRRENFI